MRTIEQVRLQLHTGSFDFSHHALNRTVERNISEQDIRQAGLQATIVKQYPNDKYSPSCLLLGFTAAGRPLHIQVSLANTRRRESWRCMSRNRIKGSTTPKGDDMLGCPVCHAEESKEEQVDEVFRVDGQYVLVGGIPSEVCVRCAEQAFSKETVEKVRSMVHGEAEASKSVSMRVFDYLS